MSEENEKEYLIQEIKNEVEKLLQADHISDGEKLDRIRKASKALGDNKLCLAK